jgi:hypothetical protein
MVHVVFGIRDIHQNMINFMHIMIFIQKIVMSIYYILKYGLIMKVFVDNQLFHYHHCDQVSFL